MTVTVANTLINNTWDFGRQRLNQLADIATRQAVTVGGNSAIGDADITGTLRANTLYTYTLLGGSIGNNQTIVIGSNINATANAVIAFNLTVGQNVVSNNVLTGIVTANTKVIVGSTTINTANIVTGQYFGTWKGDVIDTVFGGTGSNTVPPNGTLLIGNGTRYVNAALTSNTGINIVTGPGSIRIENSGVTMFRTATGTSNVYSEWRTGPVTLTGGDVINAIGFVPSAANTNQWFNVGVDLNFYQGNVAIGYTDNATRSLGKLQILSTDTATNLPGVLIENKGNNSTSGAILSLSVANNTSTASVKFQTNLTTSGAIDYKGSSGLMSFTTAGAVRGGIDGSGNLGLGTTVPQPNKGGAGIHVVANNAGITLDNGSGTQWHIGTNPNMASLGGTRYGSQFAIFSDNANTGIQFSNTGLAFIVGGTPKISFDQTGLVRINTNNTTTAGTMLQVGGDIVTEGDFRTFSDYRLKKDVEDLSGPVALQRIKDLRAVSFRWISDNRMEEGFIAHEVKPVIPTSVKGVKDAFEYQTLDKSQITPTIVKALQSLINIVEEQQEEINRLKGE